MVTIKEEFISENPFSRPARPLSSVQGIAIHWVDAAGASASNIRDYFDSLARQDETNREYALKLMGYYPGRVDGIYDDRTRDAVIRFQQDHSLAADGIIGPVTSAAIRNEVRKDHPSFNWKKRYASAHLVVGLEGEVLQLVPFEEMAYHVGSAVYTDEAKEKLGAYPNATMIGIECCHVDDEGRMTDATYNALLDLSVQLMKRFQPSAGLWLHKEVVGWKDCHRWFVNHPDEWNRFKERVNERL